MCVSWLACQQLNTVRLILNCLNQYFFKTKMFLEIVFVVVVLNGEVRVTVITPWVNIWSVNFYFTNIFFPISIRKWSCIVHFHTFLINKWILNIFNKWYTHVGENCLKCLMGQSLSTFSQTFRVFWLEIIEIFIVTQKYLLQLLTPVDLF